MKAFWLVAMLIGLLVTGWLVMRDVTDRAVGGHGPAEFKAVERAEQAVQRQVSGDAAQERRLEGAAKE